MDWTDLILSGSTALGALAAFFAWRETHSDRGKTQRLDEVDHAVDPIKNRVRELEISRDNLAKDIKLAIAEAIQPHTDALNSQTQSITKLETKMEVLWSQQAQLAMDAARIIHQPDPRRSVIDQLLEEFMDDTLSEGGERELRRYLMMIRNWEPGQDVGFPVHPGEQTAAAILLRTMTQAMPSRSIKLIREGTDDDE